MVQLIVLLAAFGIAHAAQHAEMLTQNGHVVTQAEGFKMTTMADDVVFSVDSRSVHLDANTVMFGADDTLTVNSDAFSLQGTNGVKIEGTSSSLTIAGTSLKTQANIVTLTAVTNVDVVSQTTNLTTDALSLDGVTVELQAIGQVTINSATFNVLNDDESARASMDESEVKITTPTMVVVADSTVVTGGQTFGFTTGTFRSGLLAAEAGVTMTAKNIVLVGKGGSLDLDVLYEDLEAMLAEAESLDVAISSADTALLSRAQEQATQLLQLSMQRSSLSSAISTEKSDITAQLADLASDILMAETGIEEEIISDANSVEARSNTNGGAIAQLTQGNSAVSTSVVGHASNLETAMDSLEAKIDQRLGVAATDEAALSSQVANSLSALGNTFDTAKTAAGAAVQGVEMAEASLNSRFIKAQTDVTNKAAAANGLMTQLEGLVSASESKAVGIVVAGNDANAFLQDTVALGKTLSSMVKNNDQNIVVAASVTLSTHQKTIDRAKVLLAEVQEGDIFLPFSPSGVFAYDYYARSCDQQGDNFACGAYASGSGSAFIHTVDGTTGKSTLQQTISPTGLHPSSRFGTSVQRSKDDMIIGSPYDYSTPSLTEVSTFIWGRAFLFKKVKDVYVEQHRLVPSPLSTTMYGTPYCGNAVAINGNVAVMSCYLYGLALSSDASYLSGAAMVFDVATGVRTAILTPPLHSLVSRNTYTYFGFEPSSIAMPDSSTIVIGAYGYDKPVGTSTTSFYFDIGSTFLYSKASNGAWGRTVLEPAHLTNSYQNCGRNLRVIDPLTFAVGCPRYLNYGAIQIFTRPNVASTAWSQFQVIPRPSATPLYEDFGYNIGASTDGKRLIVGAPGSDNTISDNGKLFFFTRQTSGLFTLDAGNSSEWSDPRPSLSFNRIGQSDMGFGSGYTWMGTQHNGNSYNQGAFTTFIEAELFPDV